MNWRMKWRNLSGEKRLWILFLGGCFFLEFFFIQRAFRGFNTADEMYFVGTAERIFRGERILIDEWHPAQQLCAFLTYPFYGLLRMLLGSTEGIVMAFRLLSLALHFLAAFVCFWKLRSRGKSALLTSWLFLAYVPHGFLTLSYNTIEMTILPLLLICISGKAHHKAWEYVVYGLMSAVIVLANPFAVVLYGAYGLLCLCFTLWSRGKQKPIPEQLHFRSFLWMSLGAALLAAVFCWFIFSRGSMEEILNNLPHIVGDAEHEQGADVYWEKTIRYFHLCFKNYKYMFLGLAAVYAATLLDRKRYAHGMVYLTLGALCTVPYLIYYGFFFEHFPINYQMLPLAFLGLEAYLLTEEKNQSCFWGWYVPAILFTMFVQYASNTGIVSVSAAYGSCTLAAVGFLWDWGEERGFREQAGWKKSFVRVLLLLILGIQFAGTLYLRLTYVVGDDKTWRLTARMEEGPLKGVYTTKEQAEEYDLVRKELDSLSLTAKDQLLVVGVAPWIYLCTDAGCGSYSTWQVHENSTQLIDYYALHPDKFPTVIYMMHWGEDFMASTLAGPFFEKGYEVTYLERGIVMEAPDR